MGKTQAQAASVAGAAAAGAPGPADDRAAAGALFVLVAGVFLLRTMPVDAIPDLSDTQVIVYTDYPGQAPQVVEDQVTYPLLTTFLAVPKVKVVRGQSMFSSSFVYVIFQDRTDLYWARSRVLEYLNAIQSRLPAGAQTGLGLRDARARLLPWSRGHREGRNRCREGWTPGAGR